MSNLCINNIEKQRTKPYIYKYEDSLTKEAFFLHLHTCVNEGKGKVCVNNEGHLIKQEKEK